MNHLLEGLDNLLARLVRFVLKQAPGSRQQRGAFQALENPEVFAKGTVRAVADNRDGGSTLLCSCSSLAAKSAPWKGGCCMSEEPPRLPTRY